MTSSEAFPDFDTHAIEKLIAELESDTLSDTSKILLNKILKIFSKVVEDAKSSKMTIAKLKSMLGFFSEKQKK